MAKIDLNSLLAAVSGSIGDLTIVKKKSGRAFLRQKPSKPPKKTAARKNHQTRFGHASMYAAAALSDPVKRALYETIAKTRGISAQNLAIQDRMHPPEIRDIDLSDYTGAKGECIRINAHDLVAVAEVRVVIRNQGGEQLEHGPALHPGVGNCWSYHAQSSLLAGQIVQITVSATDHAENQVERTVAHLTG